MQPAIGPFGQLLLWDTPPHRQLLWCLIFVLCSFCSQPLSTCHHLPPPPPHVGTGRQGTRKIEDAPITSSQRQHRREERPNPKMAGPSNSKPWHSKKHKATSDRQLFWPWSRGQLPASATVLGSSSWTRSSPWRITQPQAAFCGFSQPLPRSWPPSASMPISCPPPSASGRARH